MRNFSKAILVASAALCLNLSAFSQNVSFSVQNVTVKEAMEQLKKTSGYSFVFSSSDVDTSKKVSVSGQNSSIQDIIKQILQGQNGLDYEIQGKKVIIKRQSVVAPTLQNGKKVNVKGKVLDANGEPIIGATVKEVGTINGTITDFDGSFSFEANENGTLEISYIGYKMEQIKAQPGRSLAITMKEDTETLDEVVVIGYGTVKKRDLTGSVASVTGKDIVKAPVSNAAQALQGKLPGVNVISQDGRPDAEVSIRVRGGGSISQSNEPLYIVDGFPASGISDIPADMIESIDVLKDASSTAIYGARGANGVIIVTTKGANTEGKISVKYNGYVQFKQPTKYLETMNAYDYIAYNWGYADAISDTYREAWEMLWAIGPYASQYNNIQGIDHYKNVEARDITRDVYGNAFSHSHNLTLSGGNERTKV